MKKNLLKLLLVASVAAPSITFAQEKLMTIVTSEDSMTQLMAMVLSTQAQKQGAEVEVLFCSKAADLVVKGTKEVTFKPKGMSPNKLLSGLIKSGAKVGVCPPYLPNNNKTTKDLIEGVEVVNPPMIAKKLISPDVKILSY